MFNNWGFKILSFFLAFMIWLYISEEKDVDIAKRRERNKIFNNISVHIVHHPSFILQSELNPKHVSVQLRGSSYVLDELTSKNILVFVDISTLKNGEYILPVQIKIPVDVKLVQVTPSIVKVHLKDEKTVKSILSSDIFDKKNKGEI